MGSYSSTPTKIKQWMVYCNNDKIFKPSYSVDEPIVCPTDELHTVDISKTIDAGEISSRIGGVEVSSEVPDDGSVLLYSSDQGKWISSSQSITLIEDVKLAGVNGGDFDKNTWITRDLNTISTAGIASVTLASNQFTISPGTYYIAVQAPAYAVRGHRIRIYNVTDSSVLAEGSTSWSQNDLSYAILTTVKTLTESKTCEIQHRCSRDRDTTGFGVAVAFDSSTETYTTVQIIKVK